MSPKHTTTAPSDQKLSEHPHADDTHKHDAVGVETKALQGAFLSALAAGRSVRQAAECAGIAPDLPYVWREQDMDFAVRWVTAEEAGTDIIEEEAFRRAVNGVQKPVFRAGEVVGHVADYSDTMLMFLLKARRPDRYGAKPAGGAGGSGGSGGSGKSAQASAEDTMNLKGARDALVSKFLAVTAAGET